MAAISKILKRLGYVKLDQYGLLLTAEDRILGTRPVLEDGLGGRIVGWRDADLAAMELERWGRPAVAPSPTPPTLPPLPPPIVKPAPIQAVAPRVAGGPALPGMAAMPFVPVIPVVSAPVIMARPAPIATPEAEMSEDEWEWVIVMARARAAAEETELAARAIPAKSTPVAPVAVKSTPVAAVVAVKSTPVAAVVVVKSTPVVVAVKSTPVAAVAPTPPRRTRLETLPPPVGPTPPSTPMARPPTNRVASARTLTGAAIVKPLAADVPKAVDPWIEAKTQVDDTQVTLAAPPAPRAMIPRASSPSTVIPVPKLPRMESGPNWVVPVVRTMPTPIPPSAPRRFPKGTGPQEPDRITSAIPEQPKLVSVDDHTVPNIPSIPLRPPVAATALPSIKRSATRG